MNKVILIGNLANDVELRTTQNGKFVAQFRLAVQRKFANQQGKREADFINIIAWDKLGETCAKYLAKGRKAAIVGSLQTRDYTAQDGSKRYVTEVVAAEVEFVDTKPQATNEQSAIAHHPQTAPDAQDEQDVPDDELPF
ncbi:MAG: single-stranded DNA-binding protein [Alphaproteobacteria bacterium]|nr:single-stranded DNA-binding protein [Alphaproteobacteria bacterium]